MASSTDIQLQLPQIGQIPAHSLLLSATPWLEATRTHSCKPLPWQRGTSEYILGPFPTSLEVSAVLRPWGAEMAHMCYLHRHRKQGGPAAAFAQVHLGWNMQCPMALCQVPGSSFKPVVCDLGAPPGPSLVARCHLTQEKREGRGEEGKMWLLWFQTVWAKW